MLALYHSLIQRHFVIAVRVRRALEVLLMQVKRWNDEFGLSLAVSINVSPLQLVDRDFLTNIKQICTDENIDPSSIYLDISNEVIMGASIAAKEALG